jgi:hypothetical protein
MGKHDAGGGRRGDVCVVSIACGDHLLSHLIKLYSGFKSPHQ